MNAPAAPLVARLRAEIADLKDKLEAAEQRNTDMMEAQPMIYQCNGLIDELSSMKTMEAYRMTDSARLFIVRALESYRSLFAHPPAQAWIPVTERLPEPERAVLVCMANGFINKTCWYHGEFLCPSKEQPTHWQPLPPPPEGAGE